MVLAQEKTAMEVRRMQSGMDGPVAIVQIGCTHPHLVPALDIALETIVFTSGFGDGQAVMTQQYVLKNHC
jgi:hypothetical protein